MENIGQRVERVHPGCIRRRRAKIASCPNSRPSTWAALLVIAPVGAGPRSRRADGGRCPISIAHRRKGLSLFRITRRIIAPIFSADVLGTRFVRGCSCPRSSRTMPCCAELRSSGFGMPAWPPCLPPMSRWPSKSFALPFENSGWPQILELVIVRQCAGIAVGRSTALQRVRGACRRTFVLVAQLLFSQVPKFGFLTFGRPACSQS